MGTSADLSGRHANGAIRAVSAVLSMGRGHDATRLLSEQIGLTRDGDELRAGDFILRPVPGSPAGLAELHIAVRDLAAAVAMIPGDSIARATDEAVRIDPAASCGARLVLVPEP